MGERLCAEDALKVLIEGNWRFMNGISMGLNRTPLRRRELVRGQSPFAAVLGCSDSRVPPELIFDAGLGELIVVRTAGIIPDEGTLGNLEYAAENLGIRLAVVLGHTGCGTVGAAVQGARSPGYLEHVLDAIRPAVERTRRDPGEGYLNCITANVVYAVNQIAGSPPVLQRLVRKGELKVVGALYDMESGEVKFFSEPGDEEGAAQEPF